MTGSIEGLFLLNGLFLLAGLCLLWGVRGWQSLSDLLSLAGVAYMVGLASIATPATLVLVAGGGLSLATILGLFALVAGAGVVLGVLKRRALPSGVALERPRPSTETLLATGIALLTVTLLVALYRVARWAPLDAFDAWAFWVQKSKTIYLFGGLDEELFRAIPGPSYPLLVPALQAMDFRLMGAADTTTLTVQHWFLFAGFVTAAAGLLRSLASPALVWLFLGLAVVTPEIGSRILHPQADWPLQIFYVLAALFAVRWLLARETWPLLGYGVMLAAAVATKREGTLLALGLAVALMLATVRRPRAWIPIAGLAGVAVLLNVPWVRWWTSRDLPGEVPEGALTKLGERSERFGPSVDLVTELLFSYDMWLLAVPLAVAAAVAALSVRGREPAVVFLVAAALSFAGWVWLLWADPEYEFSTRQSATPIPRAVGSIVLLSLAFAPLLLERLLRPPRAD